jgi:DNA-binding NarL/FixJ family response regulator
MGHLRKERQRERRDSGRSVTVVVADRSSAFCAGVRAHLSPPFSVVGEAASVAELAELADVDGVAVALVGSDLPGGGLAAAMKTLSPLTRVVALGSDGDDGDVIAALKLGAAGYLLRSVEALRLNEALRTVAAGDPWLDAAPLRTVIDEVTRRGEAERLRLVDGSTVTLTPREKEVALLLRENLPTKQIAAELRISSITVRRHVSQLIRKLGVPTRSAAVAALRR